MKMLKLKGSRGVGLPHTAQVCSTSSNVGSTQRRAGHRCRQTVSS